MPFSFKKFRKYNLKLFISAQHEDFISGRKKARWLEDTGIRPGGVLGEGDYKNYKHEKANAWWKRSNFKK